MKKEVGEMSMNAIEDTKVCNKHEHSSGIQVSKDGVIQSVVPLGGGDQMRVLILCLQGGLWDSSLSSLFSSS